MDFTDNTKRSIERLKTTATAARKRLAADEAIIRLKKTESRDDENAGDNSKLLMRSRRAIWTLGFRDELVQMNGYCEITACKEKNIYIYIYQLSQINFSHVIRVVLVLALFFGC